MCRIPDDYVEPDVEPDDYVEQYFIIYINNFTIVWPVYNCFAMHSDMTFAVKLEVFKLCEYFEHCQGCIIIENTSSCVTCGWNVV